MRKGTVICYLLPIAFCVGDQLWDARGLERQARLEPGNHNAGGKRRLMKMRLSAST